MVDSTTMNATGNPLNDGMAIKAIEERANELSGRLALKIADARMSGQRTADLVVDWGDVPRNVTSEAVEAVIASARRSGRAAERGFSMSSTDPTNVRPCIRVHMHRSAEDQDDEERRRAQVSSAELAVGYAFLAGMVIFVAAKIYAAYAQ